MAAALSQPKAMLVDATETKRALNWNSQRNRAGIKPRVTVHRAEDVGPELRARGRFFARPFRTIVVETDGGRSLSGQAAFMSSQVLLVPTLLQEDDMTGEEDLVSVIDSTRLYNPTLKVLVVGVRSIDAVAHSLRCETEIAQAFTRKILGACLAKTIVHDSYGVSGAFERGLSVLDGDPRNERDAAEIRDLYLEIVKLKESPVPADNCVAMMNAIQRMIRCENSL